MKALLICEYREGKLLGSSYELIAFAETLGAEIALLLIGSEAEAPKINGKVYLADVQKYGEYNPDLHKKIVLEVVARANPDYIVFSHSSSGWDLAPRVATALKAGQISGIVGIVDGKFEVGLCNAKLRRTVVAKTQPAVLTLQPGVFMPSEEPSGMPTLEWVEIIDAGSALQFAGYEPAEKRDVDLSKAEVVVGVGRGVRNKEDLPIIAALAHDLGGELGASRPLVDAGWVESSRQIGISGQIVSPRLYLACGISGAIQHLVGMNKSDFIVAINKDKDAPIGTVADVMVVADVMQFISSLRERLS